MICHHTEKICVEFGEFGSFWCFRSESRVLSILPDLPLNNERGSSKPNGLLIEMEVSEKTLIFLKRTRTLIIKMEIKHLMVFVGPQS